MLVVKPDKVVSPQQHNKASTSSAWMLTNTVPPSVKGETPGSEFIMSSALKRVDVGVYDMVQAVVEGGDFPGGANYALDVANGGIGYAPKHDADIDDSIYDYLAGIEAALASGDLDTGVDVAELEVVTPGAELAESYMSMMEDMDMDENMEEDMEEDMEPEATEEAG